jgi:hypothetical protein
MSPLRPQGINTNSQSQNHHNSNNHQNHHNTQPPGQQSNKYSAVPLDGTGTGGGTQVRMLVQQNAAAVAHHHHNHNNGGSAVPSEVVPLCAVRQQHTELNLALYEVSRRRMAHFLYFYCTLHI